MISIAQPNPRSRLPSVLPIFFLHLDSLLQFVSELLKHIEVLIAALKPPGAAKPKPDWWSQTELEPVLWRVRTESAGEHERQPV